MKRVGPRDHAVNRRILTNVHIARIEEFIADQKRRKEPFGARNIKNLLLDTYEIKMSLTQIKRTLSTLGYRWGKLKRMGAQWAKRASHKQRIMKFLLKMDTALRAEDAGEAVGFQGPPTSTSNRVVWWVER